MEFAKTIGTVRPDKGRYMIDIWADHQRHKLRHLPVVVRGWLPIRDEESATENLTMIRAPIANGGSVERAIAPYLKGGGDKFKARAAYGRFLVQKQKEADAGEIRPQRVRDLRGHLDQGWLLEPEGMSVHEVEDALLPLDLPLFVSHSDLLATPRRNDGRLVRLDLKFHTRHDEMAFEPNLQTEGLVTTPPQLGRNHEVKISTRERPARTGADARSEDSAANGDVRLAPLPYGRNYKLRFRHHVQYVEVC